MAFIHVHVALQFSALKNRFPIVDIFHNFILKRKKFGIFLREIYKPHAEVNKIR